jgi:8-oxo-dGTP pyrophosphatase MutT (NUDIX family)
MTDRAVAVIVQNKRLLVIHRQKGGRDYYVLPGGSVEEGEEIEQACVREAKEETGLDIVLHEQIWLYHNGARTEHYFLAAVVGGTLQLGYPEIARQDRDNRYTLRWINREHVGQINLQPMVLREVVQRYV